MDRWVLEQNIGRFNKFLAVETNEASRDTLRSMLLHAERDLALIEVAETGARTGLRPPCSDRVWLTQKARALSRFQHDIEESTQAYLLIDPRQGLHIVDANNAYAAATLTDRSRIAGQRMFDVFPDNPDDPFADGVSKLLRSLRIAAGTGLRHMMKVQRYDVQNADGVFVERYWRPRNTPISDEDGHVLYLLHHVEDVTDEVKRAIACGDDPGV
jgi:PAS domain-containing protein